jgi:hypothetical protein
MGHVLSTAANLQRLGRLMLAAKCGPRVGSKSVTVHH